MVDVVMFGCSEERGSSNDTLDGHSGILTEKDRTLRWVSLTKIQFPFFPTNAFSCCLHIYCIKYLTLLPLC